MGGGRVRVLFSCPDAVTGYKVYRDTTTAPTTLRVSPTTEEAYDNVTPGALYYYRVKATNGDGDSAFSVQKTIDVGSGLPNIGSRVIPAGGTTGQALEKASDADYDVAWTTLA
jgi:hypothetical protein